MRIGNFLVIAVLTALLFGCSSEAVELEPGEMHIDSSGSGSANDVNRPPVIHGFDWTIHDKDGNLKYDSRQHGNNHALEIETSGDCYLALNEDPTWNEDGVMVLDDGTPEGWRCDDEDSGVYFEETGCPDGWFEYGDNLCMSYDDVEPVPMPGMPEFKGESLAEGIFIYEEREIRHDIIYVDSCHTIREEPTETIWASLSWIIPICAIIEEDPDKYQNIFTDYLLCFKINETHSVGDC